MRQTKVILAVIGLLTIGFAGGFLTHRSLTVDKIKKVRELGKPRGFQDGLFRLIEASETQRKQIEPIVREYGKRMGDLQKECGQERRVMMDSMHAEMQPFLNPDQIEKLEDFSKRFRARRHQRKNPELRERKF